MSRAFSNKEIRNYIDAVAKDIFKTKKDDKVIPLGFKQLSYSQKGVLRVNLIQRLLVDEFEHKHYKQLDNYIKEKRF